MAFIKTPNQEIRFDAQGADNGGSMGLEVRGLCDMGACCRRLCLGGKEDARLMHWPTPDMNMDGIAGGCIELWVGLTPMSRPIKRVSDGLY